MRARAASASRVAGIGLRMLDLVNPLRDPSVTVALVLTFVEEVGQHDSWWWIGIVALFNLLAVRLALRLVTLTVLGCLHQLRLALAWWHPGGVLVQGEGAMDPLLFTYRGVTLRIAYGYPSRYHLYYTIDAERADERAIGWVRYAHLSCEGAGIECLEFFDNPAWLRAALSLTDEDAGPAWSVSAATGHDAALAVVLHDEAMAQLATWMAEDYRRRLYGILAIIEAGGVELPADYALLWRLELCREAGINPCEEPTPAELAAAFRLVEAYASFEVREQAAAARRQAKLMRTGQEMARWNLWVGQNLVDLVPTTVFPAEQMRPGGIPVRFATSRYDLAVTYEPIELPGAQPVGYLESVGETILAYVPQELATAWYGERWRAERSPERALYVLNGMLRSGGKGLSGDDYISWVFANAGETALVELARSGAPINIPWQLVYLYAIASKFYRVPVTVLLGEEHYLGYGVPGIHRDAASAREDGPLSGDLWEQVLRLHGWVLLGDEERGAWPGPADIAAHQLEVRRMYGGLPALFGS
jgi:hypothetical protein